MKSDKPALEKKDVEKIIGQPISDFTLASGSNKGDNVAGDLLAIKVTTTSGQVLNVVYKAFPATGNPEQREYVVKFGIFRTETCMYEEILPRIQNLLNKRKTKSGQKIDLQLPIVKFISGFNDDQNDYVCLEDVRPLGFKMQDKFNSLTLAEVTLVMKEMAQFHALTYFLINYEGDKLFEENEKINRIKYNCITVEDPMMSGMFLTMFKSYFENTVELLEPRDKALAESVRQFNQKNDTSRLHALQRFNHNRTDKKIFSCIVHGDLWTNNILFKYAQEGNRDTPTELKFIDFQLSRRGNVFEDLGYFFWTSTTPEFRKLHLTSMLNEYYLSFERTLNSINFPMPVRFTRGSFIDGFYEGILPAYIYMPFALSLQLGDLSFLEEKNRGDVNDDDTTDQSNKTGAKKEEVNGQHKEIGADEGSSKDADAQAPPAFDFNKMIETNKKMHKLRMQNSPRAMARLEDLTREIVEMKLL